MFDLLRESLKRQRWLARKFNRMRKVYREALPVLSSKQKWETVLLPMPSSTRSVAMNRTPSAPDRPRGARMRCSSPCSRPSRTGRGCCAGARALSHFGEHSAGWVRCLAAGGAASQPRRRREWLTAGAGAFLAHAAAVVIKRVVKRQRPHHPAIAVNVGTPEPAELPVGARHVDDGGGDPAGPRDRAAAAVAAGAADGVVPLGARGALPDRRARRSGGRCASWRKAVGAVADRVEGDRWPA